jgi:hypothetical protein
MAYANPPDRSGQADRALRILRDGATHRMKDLMMEGVWPETMTRLLQEGLVLRPAQGYYRLNPDRLSEQGGGWTSPEAKGRDASPPSDDAMRGGRSWPNE